MTTYTLLLDTYLVSGGDDGDSTDNDKKRVYNRIPGTDIGS